MSLVAGCPWSGLEPATLSFCERALCGWIREPANAISSFAYVIVGLYTWRQAASSRTLRWFGIMGVLIGVTSFFFHATQSFPGEFLDVGSMYTFSSLILSLNLLRLGWLPIRRWFPFYAGMNVASLALLLIFKPIGIWLFGAQIVGYMLSEFALYRRGGAIYRDCAIANGVFVVSYAVWLTDFHHVICDPDFHWITGHAVWHSLNSLCFFYLYRFYAQFGPDAALWTALSAARSGSPRGAIAIARRD